MVFNLALVRLQMKRKCGCLSENDLWLKMVQKSRLKVV